MVDYSRIKKWDPIRNHVSDAVDLLPQNLRPHNLQHMMDDPDWRHAFKSDLSVFAISKNPLSAVADIDTRIMAMGDLSGNVAIYKESSKIGHCFSFGNETTAAVGTATVENGNAIVNHIYVSRDDCKCLVSDNGCRVREISFQELKVQNNLTLPWSVNASAYHPFDDRLYCSVGDAKEGLLGDLRFGRNAGVYAKLNGHDDYGFSTEYSPCGMYVATGNQDGSARLNEGIYLYFMFRVWDLRSIKSSLYAFTSIVSPVRSVKWSPNGRFLGVAEADDFVRVWDIESGKVQTLDFFGNSRFKVH